MSTVDLVAAKTSVQSSQYKEYTPSNAVDRDVKTCAETQLENSTWWRAQLDDDYSIHTVVMKTGVGFGCELLLELT